MRDKEDTPPLDPPGLPGDSMATFEAGRAFLPEPDATGSAETLAPPPASGESAPSPASRRYRLLRVLGRGGAGDVWEAEQVGLKRLVALKRVRDAAVDDELRRESAIRECRQEALAAAALDHPNIVPVHELVEDPDGGLAFSMKLVRGEPWEKLLVEDRALLHPEEYRAKHLGILLDVAQAVAFAHSRGIVHRDIKPTQVMTGPFGETLLMDWGLALRTARGGEDQPLSRGIPTTAEARNPAGTPACMAPEQTHSTAQGIGPWTDVFLLGACLYRILAGRHLYADRSPRECFRRAAACDFEPIPEGDAPSDLRALLRDSLAAAPADRLHDASEFRTRLEAHLTGAGRRRESESLGAEAERILEEEKPATYASCEAALSLAARAKEAWSRNPRAEFVQSRAAKEYARLALANGDLQLARAQAATLRNEAERAPLLAAIGRRRAARRGVRVAAAVLGVLVLAGSLFYNQRLSAARGAEAEARLEAEQQRDAAEASLAIASAQGAGASDLIDFVLGALRDALREELSPQTGVLAGDADRISEAIARRVAAPVAEHYTRLDAEGWPEQLLAGQTNRMIESAWRLLDLRGVAEADRVARAALELRRRFYGEGHPSLASPLLAASGAALQAGDLDQAVALAEEAFSVLDPEQAPTASSIAFALMVRANAYSRAGRLDDARRDYEEAYRLLSEFPGSDIDDLAVGLIALGRQYTTEGRYEEALEQVERALALEPGPTRRAQALWSKGGALLELGLPGAEEALEESLALSRRHFGPTHSGTLGVLSTLAAARARRGDNEGAADFFREMLDATKSAYGESSEQALIAASELSNFFTSVGDYESAAPVMAWILAGAEAILPPDEPRIPSLRIASLRIGAGAAASLDAKGDPEAAEEAMRVALAAILEHPEIYGAIPPARIDIAWMLVRTGRVDEARPRVEALVEEGFLERSPAPMAAKLREAMEATGVEAPPEAEAEEPEL